MMTNSSPAQRPPPDIDDLVDEIESLKAAMIAEISELRLLLISNGIKPPPSRIDDGCTTVRQYAERHCLSQEAVLARIHRRKRWTPIRWAGGGAFKCTD